MRLGVDRKQRNDLCCLAGRQHLLAPRLDQLRALGAAPEAGQHGCCCQRIAVALVPHRCDVQALGVVAADGAVAPAQRGEHRGDHGHQPGGLAALTPTLARVGDHEPRSAQPGECFSRLPVCLGDAVEQVRRQGIEVRDQTQRHGHLGRQVCQHLVPDPGCRSGPRLGECGQQLIGIAYEGVAGKVDECRPAGREVVHLRGEGRVVDAVLVTKNPCHARRGQCEIGRTALEDLAAQARAGNGVQRAPGGERDPDVGWQRVQRLHQAMLRGRRQLAQIVDPDVLGPLLGRAEEILATKRGGQVDGPVIGRAGGAVCLEGRGLAIAGGRDDHDARRCPPWGLRCRGHAFRPAGRRRQLACASERPCGGRQIPKRGHEPARPSRGSRQRMRALIGDDLPWRMQFW